MSGKFIIPFKGLKEGRYDFDFKVDNEFFEKFEGSEIEEGTFLATVRLDKRATHLDLLVKVSGAAVINCDRCLETFSYPISCENRIIVKFGEDNSNADADVIYLPADEHNLDLMQHLYEFIYLALPIRRVHRADKDGNNGCNPEMIKKLEELLVNENKENNIDPVWDGLKKWMNNKN